MEMTTILNLAATVLALAALFGYLNHRILKLPLTIGLMALALAVSIAILAADRMLGLSIAGDARSIIEQVDFHDSLMLGMLSFLLFAGALHVNLSALMRWRLPVLLMATLGLVISTALIGVMTYAALTLIGFEIALIWCLVFGALISPTDPVAVLSILKGMNAPEDFEAKIAGESLFNDGVAVVLFLALLAVAGGGPTGHEGEAAAQAQGGDGSVGVVDILELFAIEIGVGVGLGLAGGWLAYQALRGVDDYVVELLITLALVTGVYAIATQLHASGPLAVVLAGLMIGDHGTRFAMSDQTQQHIETFWELIDEVLNAALFLLIGFELLVIELTGPLFVAMLCAIPIALLARTAAVSLPLWISRAAGAEIGPGVQRALIWGGVRGGISVALALSLPAFEGRDLVLAMTYGVVIFSILVQGLTIQRLVPAPEPDGS